MLKKDMEKVLFGGGCFWCVEDELRKITGVISTQCGYSGGHLKNPTYEDVCRGDSGHIEVVEVIFEPSILSFKDLLEVFWSIHDPTTLDRQGPDIGHQYASAIMCYSKEQMDIAMDSKALKAKDLAVKTEISMAKEFYKAEEYHQCYFQKKRTPG